VVADEPEAACQLLIDKVLERGGTDNVTVIVIKCREVSVMSGNDRNFVKRMGLDKRYAG